MAAELADAEDEEDGAGNEPEDEGERRPRARDRARREDLDGPASDDPIVPARSGLPGPICVD
jgi:hypothetical protein